MAYNFNLSDGVTPITVADGAIDTTQFSIGLIGKNVSGYGEQVAKDLVHMLEHFSGATNPINPTTGQLWYDTGNTTMNVYNGTVWVGLLSGGTGGDFIVGGDILPEFDCGDPAPPGSDIGSPSLQFCNVYATTFHGDLNGTATQAKYADLAERFESDAPYEPGTIVKIGGDKEITATSALADADVLGVISENPGYLMNSDAGEDETHPKVAFAGRVNVRISGPVKKGERLISSSFTGLAVSVAAADLAGISPFAVIGRALEDSEGGTVLAVVGAK